VPNWRCFATAIPKSVKGIKVKSAKDQRWKKRLEYLLDLLKLTYIQLSSIALVD
jgi:hypothetical protein